MVSPVINLINLTFFIMTKIVLYSVFLMTFFMGKAQEPFICLTEKDSNPDPSFYSKSINPVLLSNTEIKVYNIFFWRIRNSLGQIPLDQPNLTEEIVLEGVANLNLAYNEFNIFFKYRGISDYISPPDLPLKVYDYIENECVDQYDVNGDIIYDPHGYGW